MSVRKKILIISSVCLPIFVIIGLINYVNSSNRLGVASDNIEKIANQVPAYLVGFDKHSSKSLGGTCENQSRPFSFTVYFTCSAGYTVTLVSKSDVSDSMNEQAQLSGLLESYNVESVYSNNDISYYAETMDEMGFWENDFTIKGSGITGVDQSNIYDAEGMADIKISISAFNLDKYKKFSDGIDPSIKKYGESNYRNEDLPTGKHLSYFSGADTTTSTSVLIKIHQKYDSCTAPMLPCDISIAR